jgi:hypothetical protein
MRQDTGTRVFTSLQDMDAGTHDERVSSTEYSVRQLMKVWMKYVAGPSSLAIAETHSWKSFQIMYAWRISYRM